MSEMPAKFWLPEETDFEDNYDGIPMSDMLPTSMPMEDTDVEYTRSDLLPQWVPVSEGLPEIDRPVLVQDADKDNYVAFYNGVNWLLDAAIRPEYSVIQELLWFPVTHWMPLPQPPEEQA